MSAAYPNFLKQQTEMPVGQACLTIILTPVFAVLGWAAQTYVVVITLRLMGVL